MRIRRLVEQGWELLGSQGPALVALLLLAVAHVIAFALPQIPVAADQGATFSRWLAEYRPQLGEATQPLASLGLLTIRTSAVFRVTLAVVGLMVAAHLDRLRSASEDGVWSAAQTGRLLICVGGLLIIGGWAGQMLSGWRDPEVLAWPDEDIVVAAHTPSAARTPSAAHTPPTAHDLVLPQPTGPLGIWPGGYGTYVIARGQRVGLEIEAFDDSGAPLPLMRTVDETPDTQVRLAFTTSEPEAFFAIQEPGLIFRLNQIEAAIQVQAYRSASGELLTETLLGDTDAGARLLLDGADIAITQTFLSRYEVVYNPGAAPEALGMALLLAGVILGLALKRSSTDDVGSMALTSDEGPELTAS